MSISNLDTRPVQQNTTVRPITTKPLFIKAVNGSCINPNCILEIHRDGSIEYVVNKEVRRTVLEKEELAKLDIIA